MNIEQQERISFTKLHSILQTDVFYGVRAPFIPRLIPSRDCEITESGEDPSESEETASIISTIYSEHPANPIFVSFQDNYRHLPCSGDPQRHLVFIWCGLLGLKYQRDGKAPSEPSVDLLKNWMRDFDIGKQDLKSFLRKNSWPLPANYYFSEPDNTKNRVKMSIDDYRRFCELQLEELPRLLKSRRDLEKAYPETMTERKAKLDEESYLDKRIQTIREGRDPDKKPARKEERNHKMLMIALEYKNDSRNKKRKKSWRWISEKIAKMDIAEGLAAGSIREILRNQLKFEKMEGN